MRYFLPVVIRRKISNHCRFFGQNSENLHTPPPHGDKLGKCRWVLNFHPYLYYSLRAAMSFTDGVVGRFLSKYKPPNQHDPTVNHSIHQNGGVVWSRSVGASRLISSLFCIFRSTRRIPRSFFIRFHATFRRSMESFLSLISSGFIDQC